LGLRGADEDKLVLAMLEADGRPLIASALLDGEGFAARKELGNELTAVLQRQVSAVAVAERWQQRDWLELLGWLQTRIAHALRCQLGQVPAVDAAVAELSRAAPTALFALMDNVAGLVNQTQSGSNPNKQLALETLLFSACDAINRKTA
jgi:hypothetical protein